jgi:hypothetical protein
VLAIFLNICDCALFVDKNEKKKKLVVRLAAVFRSEGRKLCFAVQLRRSLDRSAVLVYLLLVVEVVGVRSYWVVAQRFSLRRSRL